jgi:regulator of RNase E activity RraA
MEGLLCRLPGAKAVGPALTLRFLPRREDQVPGFWKEEEVKAGDRSQEERTEKRSALWAVMDDVRPGDILVVDGRGDLTTGCLGEMLITFLQAHGAAGLVVDGCIRDFPAVRNLGFPLWTKGFAPGGAGHLNCYPWDFNIPIGCGNVLVLPGDIIVADDDGVVVLPPRLAPQVIERASEREEHEVFVRMKLSEGGALNRYYPFDEEGRREYEEWLQKRQASAD